MPKANNPNTVETPEPRSMRLNKSHRKQILDSIADAWRQQHGSTQKESDEDLLRLLFRTERKGVFKNRDIQAAFETHLQFLKLDKDSKLKTYVAQRTTDTVEVYMENFEGQRTLKKRLRLMSDLLPEWAAAAGTESSAYINNNEYPSLFNDGEGEGDTYGKWAESLDWRTQTNNIKVIIKTDSQLWNGYKAEMKLRSQRRKELDQLLSETETVLEEFNTTKQVRDGWPELVPHLPAVLADPHKVVTLPALAKSRLNERLGL